MEDSVEAGAAIDDHSASGSRFAGTGRGRRRQQNIEQALFGVQLRFVGDVFQFFFAHIVDGDLDQIAHHRLDIAADVADLGKLRSLHFQERRVGQLGQTARDFGFADAGGADHDDVLRDDLFG